MTATVIKPTPNVFLGAGATEHIRRLPQVAVGPTIDTTQAMSTAGVVVDLFQVYPGITILNLQMIQATLWSGTGNDFTAGDSDDADRFHDTTSWLSTNAGIANQYLNVGHKYASSDPVMIQATLTISFGTALASGKTVPVLWFTVDLVSS